MLLSIMGLYEYDNTLFQGLQLPEGLNKDAVINEIMLQCAELEIVYPSIDIMKLAITTWSLANQYTWQKLYDTMVVEYNPIWNVDANVTETLTGSENRDIARTGSGSNNRTVNLADNETINISDNKTINLADNETVNITDTESVKGFNSDTWAENHKNVKAGTDNTTHTGTDNTTRTGTDNITHTGTDNIATTDTESVDDDVTRSETRTQRRTGNIGVTTTQQMLEQERKIAEFNMINYIAQSFKQRFCLLIY